MPKFLLLPLLSCLWAAWIAAKKGRNTLWWSFLGSIFPVVVPVLLHLLPAVERPAHAGPFPDGRAPCPQCARPVEPGSSFCRFCGRAL